jgi:2-polyprenyl-6-methoxyphenol hydroxylase-like FAD-dependent oxidoreductase
MRVIVVGAGIGGLAAALSLHAAGIEATGIPTAEMVHFDRHGNRIWGFAARRETVNAIVLACRDVPAAVCCRW